MPYNPIISVIMPVYNAECYVSEAIESILNQTYTHFEFIIVDDGSTDDSASIIKHWAAKDNRIKPLFLPHSGRGKIRNTAISNAKGEYTAFLDSDDIALPERFSVQLNWMERTGIDICGSTVKTFGREKKLIWFPETHEAVVAELLFDLAVLLPSVMMKASIAKKHLFREDTAFEDYEYWTRLALLCRMGNIPQILIKHRKHSNQAHTIESDDFKSDFYKYSLRLFRGLFPKAADKDCSVISCVIQKKPLESLQDLELAGMWLIKLSKTPDNFLRQRMAERWLESCQRSAHLGMKAYYLYKRFGKVFGTHLNIRDLLKLKLACLLRIRKKSWFNRILIFLRKKWAANKRTLFPRKDRF